MSDTSDNFFKEYLLTHMDSKFDARWLDTVPCTREGNRLLSKLGATLTDYGVISSWGGSLYKLVPFDQEQSDQSETPAEDQEEGQGMTLNM